MNRAPSSTGLMAFVSLLFMALLCISTGCTKEQKAIACEVNSDCPIGDACINGECGTPDCLSSADCALGKYCNSDYRCAGGCETNDDCVSGEECSDGNCAPMGCRDTDLDCGYGEFCDTTTGQCYAADGVCQTCDPDVDSNCLYDTEQGPCSAAGGCPSGQACFVADYDNSFTCRNASDCPDGYDCEEINFGGGVIEGPYCLRTSCFSGSTYPSCDPTAEQPCPRGFHCQDFGSGYSCNADCGWLKENGHL